MNLGLPKSRDSQRFGIKNTQLQASEPKCKMRKLFKEGKKYEFPKNSRVE